MEAVDWPWQPPQGIDERKEKQLMCQRRRLSVKTCPNGVCGHCVVTLMACLEMKVSPTARHHHTPLCKLDGLL